MAAELGNRYAAKYDNGEMEKIIIDLLDYAQNAKSIHLAPWCYKHGYSRKWLYEIAKTYPKFDEALTEARHLLSAKILDTSFYGEGNATVGMAYLPVYDEDFVKWLEKKAEMNKISQPQAQNQGAFNEWKKQQISSDNTLIKDDKKAIIDQQ
jgi:hypothetical protein